MSPHFPILDTDYTDGHGLGSVIRLCPSLPKEIAVSVPMRSKRRLS